MDVDARRSSVGLRDSHSGCCVVFVSYAEGFIVEFTAVKCKKKIIVLRFSSHV